MTYSSNLSIPNRFLQKQNSLLLLDEEAKQSDLNDELLLPNSTRSLKRRSSLLEKSRDWARRLITLHRPRRNTIAHEKIHQTGSELDKKQPLKGLCSQEFSQNYQKYLDEDGYLSPTEIKAKIDSCSHETSDYYQTPTKSSTNPEQSPLNSSSSSNISQRIYRYHDPNIQSTVCQQQKRLPTKAFASEFQKSLSIFDYIDVDVPNDNTSKPDDDNDDSLESLKYLFTDDQKRQPGTLSRRILRRSTNASSISTDSGYGDIPLSSSRLIPVHLISCTLIPVNIRAADSMNVCCMTCTCRPSSSSTCLSNQHERKFSSHSQFFHQPLSHLDSTESCINSPCACNNKYYSTTSMHPSLSGPSTKSVTKVDDYKEDYPNRQQQQHEDQKKYHRTKRSSLVRLSNANDDVSPIARWYKPYLEREAVCDALQQADYGAFILRNSTTHSDCYALSIKVPKFTHESNIVHYLIEKIMINNTPNYRIKGTIKQFPTLLSLLIHHSVMPEILPITLNLNESFLV